MPRPGLRGQRRDAPARRRVGETLEVRRQPLVDALEERLVRLLLNLEHSLVDAAGVAHHEEHQCGAHGH